MKNISQFFEKSNPEILSLGQQRPAQLWKIGLKTYDATMINAIIILYVFKTYLISEKSQHMLVLKIFNHYIYSLQHLEVRVIIPIFFELKSCKQPKETPYSSH